ncbi:MAG: type II secretion system protein [Tepidisphaeraceae bacterium]
MQSQQGKASGFTLVELLIVIGIIALLISMLLPTLHRVRIQARITLCMSNERQLVMAAFMYSSENAGRLPEPAKPKNYSIAGWEPLLAVFMSDASNSAADVLVAQKPVGFGQLYASGYARDPRIFYDNDQQNPAAQYETYRRPAGWGAVGGDVTRSGYFCNPHAIVSLRNLRMDPSINLRYGIAPGLTPFSQPGQRPVFPYNLLVMDRTSLGDARRGHGYSWNLAFIDGSVQTFRSSAAVQLINGYNGTPATAVWENWGLHEKFLNALALNSRTN